MKLFCTLLALTFFCHFSLAQGPTLPTSTPEKQGISSAALLDFVEKVDAKNPQMNSFMMIRHGHVIANGWWKPYGKEMVHDLFSLSKSFTSTAAGLAIEEGKFSLDDPVISFFPEDVPANPSANLKNMRVRDLLTMSTGHQTEPNVRAGTDSWVKAFLKQEVPHKPGTHFLYNTAATYMVSAIVQKTTGQTVEEYLKPKLFQPLGFSGQVWGKSPQGVSLGGYGLSIRTEDIAKFGQLYLQKGKWEGKQLVPESWIQLATSKQVSNGSNPKSDWDQGYGFQFWRCRHDNYRGDGAFGQYCIVLPKYDAVIAITSGVKDMGAVMNHVWETLLPAMKEGSIKEDAAAHKKLTDRLANLEVPQVASVNDAKQPESAAMKQYQFPKNAQGIETISFQGQKVVMKFTNGNEAEFPIESTWNTRKIAFGNTNKDVQTISSSSGWTADNTLTLKLAFVETPFITTAKMTFKDGKLGYQTTTNVGFGSTSSPEVFGEGK